MSTVDIKYNDTVIASLSSGKEATLPCAGLKMTGNLIITVPSDIVGAQPQLFTPTGTIEGDTLTIEDNAGNGSFVTGYDIYVDGVQVAYVAKEV